MQEEQKKDNLNLPTDIKEGNKEEEKRREWEAQEVEDPEEVAKESKVSMFSLYNLTRQFCSFVSHIYFREISVLGTENIPETGPVIFCGNHSNQFMDGFILLSKAGRDVRFMAAGVTMRKPIMKEMCTALRCIPVERPIDHAKPGTGKISYQDAQTVIGHDTKFTE